ncbi:MAG TPA: 3-isopropylmalate dehydratase small subunit [Vitreimonas sp.]|uniref:3-isopropylmalate dehydratase small subunit n=1 Tax=Vitreimonas sp. TaxID=3069702 RepID=UPI002D347D83|nr:3-isopropylmalate dehydratase small subunit [Vitreimonas sp.]HYD88098.1 3-isopropylmalate dehydratase small subunit [Vitreimonas sp.]
MPERFTRLTSRTFVMPQASIDTDQIIPARFLTTTSRDGLGAKLFYDRRFDAEGKPIADEPLNTIDPSERRILVAGDNFGCGSSREHAPWALLDYGFRAVISTAIADIFTSNALKNGLLPIQVDGETLTRLMADPGGRATIDVEKQELTFGDEAPMTFKTEPFARQCLLEGVDPLGWLADRIPAIEAYERSRQEQYA